ncbi:MAG: oligopeptide:H+ symporter [Coriobacteriia bacterium]|nr:oligopeptide:H+ symporter [Coriobacteriia bacterium]
MSSKTSEKPKRSFFGHPMGLLNIFSTELCERFSYYGMRAILLYYIYNTVSSGGLGVEHTEALVIVSLFGSLVYLSSILGGWLADRVFGPYKGVLYGGLIITVGHVVLGMPWGEPGLFAALFFIIVGTGMLKPNVSVMVGELYTKDDPRRQAGFSLLVMAINIGSFLAPLIVGATSVAFGYHTAFLIPAVMMMAAVFIYVILGKTTLQGIGREPVQRLTAIEKRRWGSVATLIVGILVALFVFLGTKGLLNIEMIGNSMPFVCTILAAVLFLFIILDKNTSKVERSRVFAFIPIFLVAAVFWAIAEQQSTTIALVVDTRIDNNVMGYVVPSAWYASVNPLVIIVFAPIFALIWTKLGKRQPSIMVKMSLGLWLAFLGFAVFALAFISVGSGELVSPVWILTGISLMTLGELMLSPTGLSATTLLAPDRHMSKMMGLWFVSNALGQGIIALTSHLFNETAPADFYLAYALVALVCGTGMFLARKKLLALAQGVR